MRLRQVALVVFVLLIPMAHAGERNDPEIADTTGALDLLALRGSLTILAPEIDIERAWFDSNQTTLGITWEVVDASHRLEENEGRGFEMRFTCGTDAGKVWVWPPGGPFPGFANAFLYHANGTAHGYVIPWSETENVIRVEMPRDLLSCDVLERPAATSIFQRCGQSSCSGGGPLIVNGGAVWPVDWAPNSGYGRDFAMG